MRSASHGYDDGDVMTGSHWKESQSLLPSSVAPSTEFQRPKKAPLYAWLLLTAAVLAVSSAATAFKMITDVPPITLAAWRLQLTGLLLMLPCAWQLHHIGAEQRARAWRSLPLVSASGAALAVHFALWVWGLQNTSLAHSLLLVCSAPVIIAAWALIMRQPISRGEVLGTLLAVIGAVVLAFGANAKSEHDVHLSGDAASFLAAVAVVGYLQIGSVLRKWMPIFVYACPVTMLAGCLLTLAAWLVEGSPLFAKNSGVMLGWITNGSYAPWVVYLACGPGIVGHTGFNTVLAHLPTLTIGLAISLEPLTGSLIGWAAGVAGPPGLATLGGGALVLAATIIVTIASGLREAAAAAYTAPAAENGECGSGKGSASGDVGSAALPARDGWQAKEQAMSWDAENAPCFTATVAAVHSTAKTNVREGGGLQAPSIFESLIAMAVLEPASGTGQDPSGNGVPPPTCSTYPAPVFLTEGREDPQLQPGTDEQSLAVAKVVLPQTAGGRVTAPTSLIDCDDQVQVKSGEVECKYPVTKHLPQAAMP